MKRARWRPWGLPSTDRDRLGFSSTGSPPASELPGQAHARTGGLADMRVMEEQADVINDREICAQDAGEGALATVSSAWWW